MPGTTLEITMQDIANIQKQYRFEADKDNQMDDLERKELEDPEAAASPFTVLARQSRYKWGFFMRSTDMETNTPLRPSPDPIAWDPNCNGSPNNLKGMYPLDLTTWRKWCMPVINPAGDVRLVIGFIGNAS